MLHLDVGRLMEQRVIENPRSFLVKSGFTYHAAGRLLRNELAGLRYIEELCIVLNCTPNDLFVWSPDEEMKEEENLALNKLARKRRGQFTRKLKELPLEKLEELHLFIDKLTNNNVIAS